MIVYVVTFKNGKKYVGATSRTLEKRKSDHRSACDAGVRNKFYNAIRKHGWDSLSWRISSLHKTAEDMFQAEIDLIKSLDSQKLGYNTTAGGQGCLGRPRSDEEIARISAGQRRRFSDLSQRSKAAQSMKDWIAANPEAHHLHASRRAETLRRPENREAISISLKRHFESPITRSRLSDQANRIYCERPDVREKISRALGGAPVSVWKDGELVAVYPTLSQCSRELGLRIGNIGMVLNGKRNHTGGFQFTREAA